MEKYADNLNEKKAQYQSEDNKKIEGLGRKEELISKEEIQQIIGEIKNTYREAFDEMFKDEDPLKQRVLDYFVNRADVDDEYTHILSNLSDLEKRQYVNTLQDSLKDSGAFMNKMERYFTTQAIYKSEKGLKAKPKIATQEEYQMGVYSDFLEPQVREAVFTLNKKGYKTFQSGYSEKNPKNQYIDVYNSKVEIPETLKDTLHSYGIEIKVESFDDRTTITLQPIDTNKIIRQDEWQKIWADFSEQIPEADTELVKNMEEPTLQRDFRKVQDLMKELKQGM